MILSKSPRADRLQTRLSALLAIPVSVIITDNAQSMISAKRKGGSLHIRLHHMFLEADRVVIKALAKYLSGNGKGHRKRLRAFIKSNEDKIRRPSGGAGPRKSILRPDGRFFNLKEIFDRLNIRDFRGKIRCGVTWGYRRRRPARDRVRLGSYSEKTGTIRINPILDRSFVPLFVIEDVLHHEMLHCRLGAAKEKRGNVYHHRLFREREKAHPSHQRAKKWLRENLPRLVASPGR